MTEESHEKRRSDAEKVYKTYQEFRVSFYASESQSDDDNGRAISFGKRLAKTILEKSKGDVEDR